MATKKSTTEHSPKELEQIGQMLVSITEAGYADQKRFYKMNFIKGVLVGLGTAVGATIVVGIVVWILSFFDSIPLVDQIVNTIENSK